MANTRFGLLASAALHLALQELGRLEVEHQLRVLLLKLADALPVGLLVLVELVNLGVEFVHVLVLLFVQGFPLFGEAHDVVLLRLACLGGLSLMVQIRYGSFILILQRTSGV